MSYNIKLFPNPASSNVSVSLDESNNSSLMTKDIQKVNFKEISSIIIRDKLGNIKSSSTYIKGSKKVNVDISFLITDIYFVEVSDGTNKARIPLSVKK